MRKKCLSILIGVYLLLVCMVTGVSAGENTTYTYTVSVDENWIRTQDAYMPGSVYLKGSGLVKPTDIFWHDKMLYVADSGNGRIVILNIESGEIRCLGENVLAEPSGLFVQEDGTIYVADLGLKAVVVFSADGKETLRIGRPDSVLFSSQSVYQPKNVVVSSQGNIFVIGQGAYEGIMQFSKEGLFQGYFAANKRKLTFLESIQEWLFTDEQKDQLLSRIPRAIENMDITDRDLIYSVTQSEYKSTGMGGNGKIENYLKLHNIAGQNILSRNMSMVEEWNFSDVSVGIYGNAYALTATGLIYEYDSFGNLIFSFGGRAVSSDRAGLFTVASAIDVDDDGVIYVLDEERALVQTFFPTEFAAVTHKAIYDLENGNYKQSENTWNAVLKLNGNSRIAHLGYGKSLFHQQRYKEAMEQFYLSNDKEYYSEAFWEIRSEWLNGQMLYILIALILVAVFFQIRKFHRKRQRQAMPADGCLPAKEKPRLIQDFLFIKQMFVHPLDGYYYLKRGERGSILSATMLYVAEFVLFATDLLCRSFIFQTVDLKSFPIMSVPIMFFIPLFLWIFGSTMVGSINEGEGSFKKVYISTAYSLTPYLVFTPFIVLFTYILTANEAFLISFTWMLAVVWTGVLLGMGVMEIHNYTLKETIKNIVLILFFMVMAVVAITILYLIWTQVFSYLQAIGGEVFYRALG